MAHITKRTTARGENRWDVRWKATGRWQTKTFRRRAEADAFRRTIEAEELRGVVVDVRRSSSPFGEFATAWLASRRRPDGRPLTPATRAYYADLLHRPDPPHLWARQADRHPAAQVRAWHAGVAVVCGRAKD